MKKVVSVIILMVLALSSLSALAEATTAPVPTFDYTVLSKYDKYEYDKFDKKWSYYGAYVKEYSDATLVIGINVTGDKTYIDGGPMLYVKCMDNNGEPMYVASVVKLFVDDKLYSYKLFKDESEGYCALGDVGKQMIADIAVAKSFAAKIEFDYTEITIDDITKKDFAEIVTFCKNIVKHNVFDYADPTAIAMGNTLFEATVE